MLSFADGFPGLKLERALTRNMHQPQDEKFLLERSSAIPFQLSVKFSIA